MVILLSDIAWVALGVVAGVAVGIAIALSMLALGSL